MLITNNNYTVKCNHELQIELLGNEKIGNIVNWNNLNEGDLFYDDNDKEYLIIKIDHVKKYVELY